MTVYVDSVQIPETVDGRRAKWSHLASDQYDPAELHAFAKRIGLKREWFQCHSKIHTGVAPPWLWHYDVTDSKRAAALAAGAELLVGWSLGHIITAKRDRFNALSEEDQAAEQARWKSVALGTDSFDTPTLFGGQ
jgi:hypothetical protein